MEEIIRVYNGLVSNQISSFFTWVIAGYFLFSCLLLFGLRQPYKKPKLKALIDLAPSALTTLGILGTFFGIFIGLLDFDIRTINKSVPALLEGLKVAFGTSILGLSMALIFKVMRPIISSQSGSEDTTAQDILSSLANMTEELKEVSKASKAGFDGIRKALSDDGDGSVVGQLQRLRGSVSDLEKISQQGFERQIREFREFAERMSTAFSEAIIEELKGVIREFNEKISEQFGDNFKQLNLAVGRLLEWQENYKLQLEDLEVSFDKSVEALVATENAIKTIEKSSSAIPVHMEAFSKTNELLVEQLGEMHEGLSSISEMRRNAEGAIPEIAAKIDEMTETIKASVASQKDTIEVMKSTVETSTSELERLIGAIGVEIESSMSEQKEAQKQMLDGLQSALSESLRTTTNHLNDAVVQFDEAMQREIESVVRTMAESLSGVAQKFVEDYHPLLEQTRKIAELSKRVDVQ